jgi:hypothetical protein
MYLAEKKPKELKEDIQNQLRSATALFRNSKFR